MNKWWRKTSFLSTVGILRSSRPRPSALDIVKYVLRGAFSLRAHNEWARFLTEGDLRTATRAQAQPHLLWKLQRPYLTYGTNLRQKLSWLRDHHDWMLKTWPRDLVERLYAHGSVELSRIRPDSTDAEYVWSLEFDQQFAKEGELVLHLKRSTTASSERLATLAFTVYRSQGNWLAHIGCIQGPSGVHATDLIRLATKEFHGLRPMVAVVLGLCAVCQSSHLERIRAISQDDHIYRARLRRRSRVKFDYDAFWAEIGGVREIGHWRLPQRLPRKSFEAIASNKRAQYRRRFALEDSICQQITDTLTRRPLVNSPQALARFSLPPSTETPAVVLHV